MKRICFLLLSALMLCLTSKAQISITSSDLPSSSGEVYVSTTRDSVNETLTDTNYIWDFSHLKASANDTVKFMDPTKISLLFYSYYGDITDKIHGGNFNGDYGVYKNSSSSYSMKAIAYKVPLAGTSVSIDMTSDDVEYNFPVKYGNSADSCMYAGSSTSIPFIGKIKVSGKRINTVDGWGKITTPYGSFNCIRVKSVITDTAVIFTNLRSSRIEYKWLAKGQNVPVMEVIVAQSPFGKQKTVYFKDSARIIHNAAAPKADFIANATDVYVGDTVKFTNKTNDLAGFDGYLWTFSPNTAFYVDSTTAKSKNPHVTFKYTGYYGVNLAATIPFFNITGDTNKANYIHVKALNKPKADFYANNTKPTTKFTVVFTDNSSNNPNQWTWIISPSTITYMNGTNGNSQNPQVRFDSVGNYDITLVSSNRAGSGNITKAKYIIASKSSGIEEYNSLSSLIEVYPNPSEGIFHISLAKLQSDKIQSAVIIDMLGRIVMTIIKKELSENFELNLSTTPKGSYWLRLNGEQGIYLKKLVTY